MVLEHWNSGKSTNSHEIDKNTQNTAKFGKNLIKYMSVQHVWNSFQLLGLFSCCKHANLSRNFVTEICKQCPETTMRDYVAKNWACTSHDVKGFAIGSFLECIVVERAKLMITSVIETLKTLVSDQCKADRLPAKFALKITTKLAFFHWLLLGEVYPEISTKFLWNQPIFPRICH